MAVGRYAEAIDHFGWTATALTRERMRERLGMAGFPSAMARSALAVCLAETGNFTAAMARAHEALQMAEAIEQPFTLTFALAGIAHISVRKGDLANAIPTLERGLTIAKERDVPVLSFLMASHLAYAHALSGHPERTPGLDQLVTQAAAYKAEFFRTAATGFLAEACLLSGRRPDSERLAPSPRRLSRTPSAAAPARRLPPLLLRAAARPA